MWMARLSGRSESLAGRQFKMVKSQRRVPTQRSENPPRARITEVVLPGGLNACSLSLSLHATDDVRCWPVADVRRHDLDVRFQGQSGRGAGRTVISGSDPKPTSRSRSVTSVPASVKSVPVA